MKRVKLNDIRSGLKKHYEVDVILHPNSAFGCALTKLQFVDLVAHLKSDNVIFD